MRILLLAIIFSFVSLAPSQKAQAMDPKAKAFMVMTAYGTVGGALLGFASMAFGGKSRAIAQGASLGLYAGIIFGTYVIMSYNKDQNQGAYNEYDTNQYYETDPYVDPAAGYGAPPPQSEPQEDSSGGGFFGNRFEEFQRKHEIGASINTKRIDRRFHVNLINMSF